MGSAGGMTAVEGGKGLSFKQQVIGNAKKVSYIITVVELCGVVS